MVKLGNKRTHLSRLSRHLRKQRIGLMGGSFNPAHTAHEEIAEVARKQAKLKEVSNKWITMLLGQENVLFIIRFCKSSLKRMKKIEFLLDL